jgi:PhnB protein
MSQINPYLNFPGNTEEAFLFYKSVFGNEFAMLMRFKDVPGMEKLPPADQEKIMHIALPLGNGAMLMATDALESMGQKLNQGNNFYISVSTDSREEADGLYHSLSAGGNIEQPIGDAFWGAYFGMFRDRFGVQWMISFDEKRQQAVTATEDELVAS